MRDDDLDAFLELVAVGHFGRAAQRCHVSTSALSRTIQRLEEELDVRLFRRDRHRVEITEAGRRLTRYATDRRSERERLRAELDGHAGMLTGHLRCYASVTACEAVLPALLAPFRAAHPQVHLLLETGDPSLAPDRVISGEADIAVAPLPRIRNPDLRSLRLGATPLICIGSSEDLAPAPRFWRDRPVILPRRGVVRHLIDGWYTRQRCVPRVYDQVAGNESLLVLVAMGYGIGFVPELVYACSPLRDRVRPLPVAPRLPELTLILCHARHQEDDPVISALLARISHDLASLTILPQRSGLDSRS